MRATTVGFCHMAAVFSDIHSNYHAFRACYDDARAQGADCFIFLGDYISDLADPRETMDLLYEIQSRYPTICLRGNRERYMLEHAKGKMFFSTGSKTGSLLFTYRQLQDKDLAFFERLPIYDVIELNGIVIEIAHAGKSDDRDYFEGTDDRTRHVFEEMETGYLLTGHSHKQYVKFHDGKVILNPGSIGVPRDHGPLTQYALLEFEEKTVQFRLRQIPYDVTAMIHRQFESGLVDCAPHWAISVLYDALTGKEHTMELLRRVYQQGNGDETVVFNESVWRCVAEEMGMKFTEDEIVRELCK